MGGKRGMASLLLRTAPNRQSSLVQSSILKERPRPCRLLRGFRPGRGLLWRPRNHLPTAATLQLFQITTDCFEVVVELGGVPFAHATNTRHNRILRHSLLAHQFFRSTNDRSAIAMLVSYR